MAAEKAKGARAGEEKVLRKVTEELEKAKDFHRIILEREKDISELSERMQYLQADFENYKKHMDRQKEESEKRANEGLITEMLPVLDALEAAIEKDKNAQDKEGIELIQRNLLSVLGKRGLRRIEAAGEKFDPYYHEALMSAPSEAEEGIVIEELQKGYTLNGAVIRHSKVRVSKGKEME
ncbi:MAG: nucleotide exchange factor GrpE [Candidatus Aenigmatarchaeota archaeon]